MKSTFTLTFVLSVLICKAQITWDFGITGAPNASPSNLPAGINATDLVRYNNKGNGPVAPYINSSSPSSSQNYTTASGQNNMVASANGGAFDLNLSTYFESILTPTAPNGQINLQTVSFGAYSTAPSGSGPTTVMVVIKQGTQLTSLTSFAINSTWRFIDPGNVNLTFPAASPVAIRIYAYGGQGASGSSNWRIDDVNVYASVSTAMPLTLLDFYTDAAKYPILKWKTANEKNVNEFQLERSDNSQDFTRITNIKANNTNSNEYSYYDVSARGKQYYRLKMIDLNGSFIYSKIISTETEVYNSIFKVAGLPILRTNNNKKQVVIYDINGKKVYSKTPASTDLSIEELPRGQYYFAEVHEGEKITRIKFFND